MAGSSDSPQTETGSRCYAQETYSLADYTSRWRASSCDSLVTGTVTGVGANSAASNDGDSGSGTNAAETSFSQGGAAGSVHHTIPKGILPILATVGILTGVLALVL